MKESEIKRLAELQAKDKEKLSDDEAAEIVRLTDKKELQETITIGLKEVLRDAGVSAIQHKTPSEITIEQNANKPGYMLHSLLCAMKSGDKAKIKEIYSKAADPMVEGTDASGGYLVPAVTQATILELIPTYGQARQYMQTIPMGNARVLNIPKEGTLPTVTWTDEAVAKTASKPTIAIITLTAKKAAGIVVLSDELLQDANVNLGDYIVRKFAQKFGIEEDKQFFNGTGSPFNGVFKSTNTFGNTVTLSGGISTLDYPSLVSAAYGIDANYTQGAAWYMHRTVLASVRNILDGQNRPIFVDAAANTPPSLLGYPVRLIENAPTSSAAAGSVVVILGNLENSIIGTKQEMTVKILDQATIAGTSLAEADLTAIRVVERVAFDAGLTEAYSVIKLAA